MESFQHGLLRTLVDAIVAGLAKAIGDGYPVRYKIRSCMK
jgi:hypothetical protein